MIAHLVLLELGRYRGHGGGGGGTHALISLIIHAAIWSAVSRFVWALPLPVVAVVGIVGALAFLKMRSRRSGRVYS